MRLPRLLGLWGFLGWVMLVCSPSWAEMRPIFGPEQFTRVKGGPKTFTRTFQACDTAARYKMVVLNGNPDSTNQVREAQIFLNGVRVVGPRDFKRHERHHEQKKDKGNDEDKEVHEDNGDEEEGKEGDAREGDRVARIEKRISVAPDNQLGDTEAELLGRWGQLNVTKLALAPPTDMPCVTIAVRTLR
jgi:hypothetical protein